MVSSVGKYWFIFRTQLLNGFAYPADLFSRSLSMVLFMWVFLHLWRVTYGAVGQETIAGLSLEDTLWYLMLAETIVLSRPRIAQTVGLAVKEGAIAYLLNKPYSFLLYQVSVSLGDSLLRMVFNLLAGGAVLWLVIGTPPSPVGWPMVFLAVIFAWLIDFCMNAMIGLLAFITEEIMAFEWIYNKFVLILGGVLIPLDFFPDWLGRISLVLPFAYTTYGPARLFVDPSLARFVGLLWRQSLWLLVLGGLLAFFYRKSVSWLSINGG
jgi:ABC-2 type transport system permease protein